VTKKKFDFDEVVMEYYLQYGRAASIMDISKFTDLGAAYIQGFVRNNKQKCDCVPVYSANAGREVSGYIPTRTMLRAVIKSLTAPKE
jgi:hypothetical protein